MKRSFLTLILISLAVITFTQQVPRDKVIVEEATDVTG